MLLTNFITFVSDFRCDFFGTHFSPSFELPLGLLCFGLLLLALDLSLLFSFLCFFSFFPLPFSDEIDTVEGVEDLPSSGSTAVKGTEEEGGVFSPPVVSCSEGTVSAFESLLLDRLVLFVLVLM